MKYTILAIVVTSALWFGFGTVVVFDPLVKDRDQWKTLAESKEFEHGRALVIHPPSVEAGSKVKGYTVRCDVVSLDN
jgi:hypothetical protein